MKIVPTYQIGKIITALILTCVLLLPIVRPTHLHAYYMADNSQDKPTITNTSKYDKPRLCLSFSNAFTSLPNKHNDDRDDFNCRLICSMNSSSNATHINSYTSYSLLKINYALKINCNYAYEDKHSHPLIHGWGTSWLAHAPPAA